ncbi:hypothetical protein GOARA_025_00150 [Gordonia araii NBRC 100433]|uniref:Ribonuclease VapC n=1 Tax=Gordonia araii NBRC 100433 TaxID=1073574 RepID=G7GZE4_9ACTN|nr:type II toxin-antitoxin system VapC family toxin [Gordonia araii]NNG98914.1 type II toxin-antitoxin system VapC family toxin [Gordonia araii NBRC 100433]GAB08969.1 hypothetical protein GOARA_025_00150 [Gordonia araii NBRC 100433]
MRRVIDSSALIDAILPTTRQDRALAAMADAELWSPAIVDLEVASALWRLARTGQISAAEADSGVDALQTAPIRRVDDTAVVGEAWRLRESVRVSDAFYVACARLLNADLITSDARLSRAHDLRITVVLLR